MKSFKLKEEIKIPRITDSQRIIIMKCESGVLLTDEDYDTLVEDSQNYLGVEQEFTEDSKNYSYLTNKYKVRFSVSALNKSYHRNKS